MSDLADDEPPRRGDERSYEVGWRRPPAGKKWKKGQSGNPSGGRKHKKYSDKKVKAAIRIRQEIATEIISVKINGYWRRIPRMRYFMLLDSQEALRNPKLRRQLLDQWEVDEAKLKLLGRDSFEPIDWTKEQEELFRELERAGNAEDMSEESQNPDPRDGDKIEGGDSDDRE